MNKILKYVPFLFGIIFICVLFLSIKVMVSSSFFSLKKEINVENKSSNYAFFLPISDYSFYSQIKKGALKASETMDCAITFFSIDDDPISLEMVPFSGLDGICLYPYHIDNKIIEAMNNITKSNIPIIQLENEIIRDENTFYIGTNNYESGKSIGKLALLSNKDLFNMVLVYSDKNPGFLSDNNLVELGLRSVLGNKLENFVTRKTNLNPLDAERLAYELVRKSPEIDFLVLTDPKDTLVAVQAIIDNNLVGKVQIIGFGSDQMIKNYIDKGIILGSIVRNPYQIGFSAIMALEEIKNSGYTSAYVDTGLSTLVRGEYE